MSGAPLAQIRQQSGLGKGRRAGGSLSGSRVEAPLQGSLTRTDPREGVPRLVLPGAHQPPRPRVAFPEPCVEARAPWPKERAQQTCLHTAGPQPELVKGSVQRAQLLRLPSAKPTWTDTVLQAHAPVLKWPEG